MEMEYNTDAGNKDGGEYTVSAVSIAQTTAIYIGKTVYTQKTSSAV